MISKEEAYQLTGETEISEGGFERFDFYLYCRQQGTWVEEVTRRTGGDRSYLNRLNPVDQLTADFPPTLLLHGDQDTDVPYEQSVRMHRKLKELHVVSELVTISGGDHVFDRKFASPDVQAAFEKTVSFLREHL